MSSVSITFNDVTVEEAADLLAVMGGEVSSSTSSTSSKGPAKEEKAPKATGKSKKSEVFDDEEEEEAEGEEEEITVDMVIELAKEVGAAIAKPILKEAGVASPAALKKAKLSDDDLAELYDSLIEASEEGEEEEAEVTVEDVKKAVQAYAKANGKDEADEILGEFDITSVRSLSKLSSDELMELYEAVTE